MQLLHANLLAYNISVALTAETLRHGSILKFLMLLDAKQLRARFTNVYQA